MIRKTDLIALLKQGDLRSVVVLSAEEMGHFSTQTSFDELFGQLFHANRVVVMHAADLVEKVSRMFPLLLLPHSKDIIKLLNQAKDKELKWHLCQLVVRVKYSEGNTKFIWQRLKDWIMESTESKIVRVNALNALHELSKSRIEFREELNQIIPAIIKEGVPSLNARIRKLNR